MSRRRFGDYFSVVDGHVASVSDAIGVHTADEMLVHYGHEMLPQLYAWDDQPEPVFAPAMPKCRSCGFELRAYAPQCGFCLEEGVPVRRKRKEGI